MTTTTAPTGPAVPLNGIRPTVPARQLTGGLDLEAIDDQMVFLPARQVTISSGTVCIDRTAQKVLLIYNRALGIYQLPKGRKHVGEDLPAAALRETFEETGVRATLLPLRVGTRATRPHPATAAEAAASIAVPSKTNGACPHHHGPAGRAVPAIPSSAPAAAATAADVPDPDLLTTASHTEFLAAVRYPDPQAATPGTEKTVFYFAAEADSAAPMARDTQDPHERLVARWAPLDEASTLLRFGADREVLRVAREAMVASGVLGVR